MKNLLIICFAVLAASCCKKDNDSAISPCLDEKLKAFKQQTAAVTIKTQLVGDEKHYWLNTNATSYDGVEYILGENCDTVCYFCGECDYPACNDNYDPNNWVVIWQK